MRRRDFIAWLGSSLATWPLPVTAHAQHASKSYRVGLIARWSHRKSPIRDPPFFTADL